MNKNYNDSGKIISLEYERDSIKYDIKVSSYYAVKKSNLDDSTAGKIIENYRELRRDDPEKSQEYFDEKNEILNDFIESLKQEDEEYDYIQIMLPKDINRKCILESFASKKFNGNNDFSQFFSKTDDVSIVGKNQEEAQQLFEYNKPEIDYPAKSLLIIDDTIDTGSTIKILLDNLIDERVITGETKITAIIIYNNYGQNKLDLSKILN